MFFVDQGDLFRKLELARSRSGKLGVSDELRGWSWTSPPVEPVCDGFRLGVSELVNRYCSTMRDLFLKYIRGVRVPPSPAMVEGYVYHSLATSTAILTKKLVYLLDEVCGSLLLKELFDSRDGVVEDALKKGLLRLREDFSEEKLSDLRRKLADFYDFLCIQAAAKIDQYISRYRDVNVEILWLT